ncbi:MAG: 16S rRNA (adenine(1518)-N(6)/adenine(1519)-N(6))-dimethyltransferase, partial [Alphaproteobacteria bacterium]|nr:16S rRNA (adenine(1518)-N(6)/adenine(1519)-N(6))-dimethyltransferase [Alphaproteobacteria bacterium]
FQPRETAISTDQISKLEKVTATAFSARRKMIRQSLKNYNNLEQACKTANIALTSRPEEITPQQFLTLSQIL